MPDFFREHLRPLAGSAGLHLLLLAILAGAALRWTSSQPPVELAIEGYVVDSAPPQRPATKSQRVEPLPKPQVDSPQPPEPAAEPAAMRREEDASVAEPAARELLETEQRAAAERQRAAEAAEAKRRAAEAETRRKVADDEAKRQAAEREAKRKAEAEDARRKSEAAAQAERDARQSAEREAALRRRLAAEEEAGAAVSAGVMDEYRRMLAQTIERSWIRPPSARAGLQCTLLVTQAPGGTVMDVTLGACNGDAAVRESITNAVYRASPLPAPRDARAFERRLEIVFKPTE
jgi:colicin import membrane protein